MSVSGLIFSLKEFFTPEIVTYNKKCGQNTYTITQKGPMKYLKYNGIVYSQLNSQSLYTHSYHDKFILLPLLYDKPKILVVGLCGGTIPYQISSLYNADIEAVDLDKNAKDLATKFLPDGKMNFKVVVSPGDKFVGQNKNRYDIIIQDAFINDRIPKEFLDGKFMQDAHDALKEDGILAINFAPDFFYLHSYIYQLKKYFKYVYSFSHIRFGNYIVICSKTFNKAQILDKIKSKIQIDKENSRVLSAYRQM